MDPATIDEAVRLFDRYALGNVSIDQLARETGLERDRIRYLLRNPLFNGWVRRHRGPGELRKPAPWRAAPPVSDALWARVEQVRRAKTRGGGPRNRGRVDLLAGLLECVCGRRIRSDGRLGSSDKVAKLHVDPCPAWGPKARLSSAIWEQPVMAQVAAIQFDPGTLSRVVAALASPHRPVSMDRARIERDMRQLALDHVAGELSDDTYLTRLAALRAALAALDRERSPGVSTERAVEWLRTFSVSWLAADVPEAKAEVLHAVYERIVVTGRRFVEARLTPAAYEHGLALALPEAVMARPEVSEFGT